MDGRFLHDAIVDTFKPVIEPAMGFCCVVDVLARLISLTVIRGANEQSFWHSQVGIDDEILTCKRVEPPINQVHRNARSVDPIDQGVQ